MVNKYCASWNIKLSRSKVLGDARVLFRNKEYFTFCPFYKCYKKVIFLEWPEWLLFFGIKQ